MSGFEPQSIYPESVACKANALMLAWAPLESELFELLGESNIGYDNLLDNTILNIWYLLWD